MRRKFALGLALLLAAATAAADTVVTIDEVVACSVESADADSIRVRLTRPSHRPRSRREAYHINRMVGRSRTLPTADVYEIRFSDPGRVADIAALLPRTRVTADSGQPVTSPEARAQAIVERWAGMEADDSTGYAGRFDTLARYASPAQMLARCREMYAALRRCERSDDTVEWLLREVDREAEELRAFRPRDATCASAAFGGLLGGAGGTVIGFNLGPPVGGEYGTVEACLQGGINAYVASVAGLIGCGVGLVSGSLVGLAVGQGLRGSRLAKYRARVNDLIRRVNRIVAKR